PGARQYDVNLLLTHRSPRPHPAALTRSTPRCLDGPSMASPPPRSGTDGAALDARTPAAGRGRQGITERSGMGGRDAALDGGQADEGAVGPASRALRAGHPRTAARCATGRLAERATAGPRPGTVCRHRARTGAGTARPRLYRHAEALRRSGA